MRVSFRRWGILAAWALAAAGSIATASAGGAIDPYELMRGMPQPPATLEAARAATRLTADASPAALAAPGFSDLKSQISTGAHALSMPSGTVSGIDLARASSDPDYAAQIQQKLAAMPVAEQMAFMKQMSAALTPSASNGAVSGFLGAQRAADQAAQRKMHDLLQAALNAAGAQHKSADAELNAEAKQCPTDKTGWPLGDCTSRLSEKSIARHRAIESAALPLESKAFADALAIANLEVNKGRALFAHARDSGDAGAGPLAAWVLTYAQILADFGEAIALRAGFWAHANAHKYTGSLSIYVDSPDLGVTWPLREPTSARTGL